MKKITIVLLAGIVSFGWVSCKKKSSPAPDPVIPRGIFAKINGVAWAADPTTLSNITLGNYVEITGYDSSGKTIDMRINNFKTRGTYTIPQANDSAFYATDFGALASPIAATTGTIVIQAETDTSVGGTFSFTAGSTVITSGTFNVNTN